MTPAAALLPDHDPSTPPQRVEVATGSFPRHLAARLVARRHRSRRPLWVMASRSRGRFTIRDLRDAEAGVLPLDADTTAHLAELYGLQIRSELPPTSGGLDVGDGTLTAAGVTVVFRPGDVRSMLEAYFRLVRTLRAIDDTVGRIDGHDAGRDGGSDPDLRLREDDLVTIVGHLSGAGRAAGATIEQVFALAGAGGRMVAGGLVAAVESLDLGDVPQHDAH